MATVTWNEHGTSFTALWRSESSAPAPSRIVVASDRTTVDAAYRLLRADIGVLWPGDYEGGRRLLQGLDRRHQREVQKRSHKGRGGKKGTAALFHEHRTARADRARLLGRLLVVLEPDYTLGLRRAPDVRAACAHAYGDGNTGAPERTCVSLSELIGVLSAYEWHLKGVDIPQLDARIHPAYSVFSPTRSEYVDLVAQAPFPEGMEHPVVFDLGTGTGVLAALLARRGARQVVATDINPRAVACARANVQRLGLDDRVDVVEADPWPEGHADVVVCNPPWLPGLPSSDLDRAVYDPDSAMLHRFLTGLADHVAPMGEGWLVLSDFAEHVGLRTRDELLGAIEGAGLRVADRIDTVPNHPRAGDTADPLHDARRREVTSLWRLVLDGAPRATGG
ncbi:class I SAM-dependent methyltransferase [Nocardiopsis sp. RSe5-2]|uniref:Class I SAM-dependent methyltransferase n=1 Tax=Nocardiopsis endophytica TaxID=3018445 RepID=A0ABT4TZE4_9ACTN|nr:class I SAM-dependent methyltransferase [Nocardiopsis endophytica]MDA2809472.1 class I SAM-dependent methyltransferase [Nocardiopsis endophytica]